MTRISARPLGLALLGALLLALLVPVGPAAAAPPAPAGDPSPQRVLLKLDLAFTPPGLLNDRARRVQSDRLDAVRARVLDRVAEAGGRTTRTYDGLPFVAVTADAAALRRLGRDRDVTAIQPDEVHRVNLAESVPHIGAPALWSAGITGAGQAVAVLDTGVEAAHPFLAGKVVAEACFASSSTCPDGTKKQIGPGSAAPCTYDTSACPHGTHVAGIVAGASTTSAGAAKSSALIAVQVFSRTTSGCPDGASACAVGWTSDLIAGLDHVATLSRSRPVAAVNLSLGGGSYTGACDDAQPALTTAITSLRSLGVATAAASGNAGTTGTMASPACITSAVAVGSTSLSDVVSSFSNSSSQLALLAPGERILSSYTQGRTAWMSGTSQATPHVSAAFALLRQAHPTATVTQILEALKAGGVAVLDTRNARLTPRVQVDTARTALALALATELDGGLLLEPSPSPSPSPTTEPSPSPSPAPTTQPTPSPEPSPTSEPSPKPDPVLAPTATRLSGNDRYDTAAAIYSAAFGCAQGGVSTAVLARGDAFADALAGSYLAGVRGTGVLLSGTTAVPAPTLTALRRSGVRTVYLLGGTAALSPTVAAQLAATPSYDCAGTPGSLLQVVRISGVNRFDTARRTAEHAGPGAVGTADLTGKPLRTAVVASGFGFADALAAGPLSYAGAATGHGDGRGFPTLLTAATELAAETEAALATLGVEQVILPGGTAVVSAAVESRLKALGLHVVRLAGENRTETAAVVARFAVERLGFGTAGVALARGDAFADALAGAAYAGAAGRPLLLTATPHVLSAATGDYLSSVQGLTHSVAVFGGTSAVSDATVEDALHRLAV